MMRYLATLDLRGIDPDLPDEDGRTPEKRFQATGTPATGDLEKDDVRDAFAALVSAVKSAWTSPPKGEEAVPDL